MSEESDQIADRLITSLRAGGILAPSKTPEAAAEPEPDTVLTGEWTHPALEALPVDDWAHAYFHAYLGPIGLGILSRSYRHAGITRDRYRTRYEDDTIFRLIHDDADTELREAFEYVLTDRTLNGTQRPVYQRGVLVGYIREVDNRLLQWVLERLMPEKYHLATKFEMSGADAPDAFTFAMGETPLELPEGSVAEAEVISPRE